MSGIEIANLVLGIIGVISGIPAIIVHFVNLAKNKYRLHTEFIVINYQTIFDFNKKPIGKLRAGGNLHYINYSHSSFNIVKIIAVYDTQEFFLTSYNPNNDRISQTINRYIPFEDFPVFPRASGNNPFFVVIPENLRDKELKLKVFTSYRKRPYKGIMVPPSPNNQLDA